MTSFNFLSDARAPQSSQFRIRDAQHLLQDLPRVLSKSWRWTASLEEFVGSDYVSSVGVETHLQALSVVDDWRVRESQGAQVRMGDVRDDSTGRNLGMRVGLGDFVHT